MGLNTILRISSGTLQNTKHKGKMQNAKYKIELTTILRISSGTFLLALHSACAEECEKITGALHTRD